MSATGIQVVSHGRWRRRGGRGPAAALALLATSALAACRDRSVVSLLEPPVSVRGTLRVGAYGSGALAAETAPLRHVTEWVNGIGYQGMEDNDLRGFLDGRFAYGWNQPGQIHVRLGRRATRPRWGETELFRTLVRWGGVALPGGARVRSAELRFEVEEGAERPLAVLLYAVNKDWNPGRGGELGDNTSPPRRGEVWWGAVSHEERTWGFPGAGFASDSHPDADTPAMPLAEVHLEPDDRWLRFSSEALARYVEQRGRRGLPLLFLVKLSDALEDTPDTLLHLYSGNHGDLRNDARRPRLRVEWESADAVAFLERHLHLENGRRLDLARIPTTGARLLVASFEGEEGYEPPTIQFRTGRGGEIAPWRRFGPPQSGTWDWVEIRILAARDPVVLGSSFQSGLRDTWVRTAPPEEQKVPWTFVSPGGELHEVEARYVGDYRWEVSFVPDELGRWRYHWRETFLKHPYRSPDGVFDVVAGETEDLVANLRTLLERVREAERDPSDAEVPALAPAFWKLERAVFQRETPEDMQSEHGRELFDLLTEIRSALSGTEVPAEARPVPMRREF